MRQPSTRLEYSAHRFVARRIAQALLTGDVGPVHRPACGYALLAGGVLAAAVLAGSATLGVLRPAATLGDAKIMLGQPSGALYVRVGDTVHPVLNVASARLATGTAADPEPVRDSALAVVKRGPLLGIPGAPQAIGEPLAAEQAAWTLCDSGEVTTMIVGPVDSGAHRLAADQAVVVTADSGPGATTYLLYQGRRSMVNLTDPAVVRALRLDDNVARRVSRLLLTAIPEAPPIVAPSIPGANRGSQLPGLAVGTVVRVARPDTDDYYVVLADGLQRIGQVAAELLRLTGAPGGGQLIGVAPDVIGGSPVVTTLPVGTFPDRPPVAPDGDTESLCVNWVPRQGGAVDISLLAAAAPPVPAGQAPVPLAQGDRDGPALDAVYLPPGRSAYLQPVPLLGSGANSATEYLVTDTGVRFAVGDRDAAADLGLSADPQPAPWPLLAALPEGPELTSAGASTVRDTVSTAALQPTSP